MRFFYISFINCISCALAVAPGARNFPSWSTTLRRWDNRKVPGVSPPWGVSPWACHGIMITDY